MLFVAILIFLQTMYVMLFFFFKQKTAYEMRISDWSSDVCSSDLVYKVPWVGSGQAVAMPPWNPSSQCCRRTSSTVNGGRLKNSCGSRSDERRVGKECVRTCRSRRSLKHKKTKQ